MIMLLARTTVSSFGLQQAGRDAPDSNNDLCGRWLESGKEANVSLAEDTKYTEEPSGDFRDSNSECELLSASLSSGTKIKERGDMVREVATCTDVEMRVVEDGIIFKSDQSGESTVQIQEPFSCISIPVAEACGSAATEIVSERIVSDSAASQHKHKGTRMESGQGTSVSVNKGVELASSPINNSLLPRTSDSDKGQEFAFKLDQDYPPADEDDAFPDIVDADPDSDEE